MKKSTYERREKHAYAADAQLTVAEAADLELLGFPCPVSGDETARERRWV